MVSVMSGTSMHQEEEGLHFIMQHTELGKTVSHKILH
jgi:hypothetical protein